jgi:hypothetical protein
LLGTYIVTNMSILYPGVSLTLFILSADFCLRALSVPITEKVRLTLQIFFC